MNAEQLGKLFHDTYEFLAPSFGYKTREASAKPWKDVPEQNRRLMIAVAEKILLVLNEQLQAKLDTAKEEIKRLRAALQDLYDEQNGPPLLRDELSWQAAMDKAEKLLESDHEKG